MLTWIQLWRMLPAGVGEMEVGEMGTEPLMAVAEIVRAAATMMGVAGDNYNPKSLKVLCVFFVGRAWCLYIPAVLHIRLKILVESYNYRTGTGQSNEFDT